MMILDATTRKLQAILSTSITTNQLPITVAYVDMTTTTTTSGEAVNNTNNTTAVDITPAPAASTQRQVKTITIYNADTVSASITIRYNDNGTLYVISKFTLPTLATAIYADTFGWNIYDSTGALAYSPSLTLTGNVTGSGIGSFVTTIPAATVTEAMQVLADNTTQDATSTKHGYVLKTPADATKFLNGAATAAFAQVKDSDLATTDITTNNASTSKHGFLLKLSNVSTEYMNGTGAWSTPAGGSGGGLLAHTVLLSGTLHTTNASTTYLILRLVGAGGGSGGCGTASATKVSGAGGGAQYVIKRVAASGSTAYTFAIGAAGTAGVNTGGNGGNGGNSTFTVGATTYTANGGSGGAGVNSDLGSAGKSAGGAGGTGTSNGDLAIDGQAGEPGYYITASATDSIFFFLNGKGGDSQMGRGGVADGHVPVTAITIVGKAGSGYGAGGAGSYNQSTATLGRAGTQGMIIVEEY